MEHGAVDPSVLDAVVGRFGDRGPAFRASLIETWRGETVKQLAEADSAAAAGDVDVLARIAHTLKSSSASLGAVPLAALCEQVEAGLRAGDDRDLVADAAALRAGVAEADAAFTALWG